MVKSNVNGRIADLLTELKLCRNLERGKRIHAEATVDGVCSSMYVTTALLRMYAKCGSMVCAREVFNSVKHPDVVAWTALISGYADNGEATTALDMFFQMKFQGCAPDSFAFVAVLKACTALALKQDATGRALEIGRQLHLESGRQCNIYVQNTLIDLYAKCGCMAEARLVFNDMRKPDVVSWNSLMLGYAEKGEGATALELFSRMRSRGCSPDSITFIGALKACSSLALETDGNERAECLQLGKQIHTQIGGHMRIHVQTILICMYGKCGSMVDARLVFSSIKCPDVASWNALMLGYVENGEAITVLKLFADMKSQGCAADGITFVAAFKASGFLGALESGRKIHAELLAAEATTDVILVTSLVDFYAKCGSLEEAQRVFDSHPRTRDLTTWTALLAGYSRSGDSEALFGLFWGMQDAGLQPDGVIFLCIFTCCSHAGLVEKAREFFEAMSSKYGVTPSSGHCACMLDILGRSNKLHDALAVLRRMPWRPPAVIWVTLLGACCKWGNAALGKLAFKSLVALDDANGAAYVLMARICGSRGMREEQETMLQMSKAISSKAAPGQSCWTNESGIVQSFVA